MTRPHRSTPSPRYFDRVKESLQRGYGLAPPKKLVVAIALALEASTQDEGEDEWIDDGILWLDWHMGFDWSVPDQSLFWPGSTVTTPSPYPGQPPEFFVFGTPGVDGISYGFLVHAPEEHNTTDYPLGEWNPYYDDTGVRSLGGNFAAGMQTLLERERNRWQTNTPSPARIAAHKATCEALAIELSDENSEVCVFNPSRPQLWPAIPKGYTYSPTPDGVGVLAPTKLFASAPVPAIPWGRKHSLTELFQYTTACFDHGHPASALEALRLALPENLFDEERKGPIVHAMAEAYRRLQRPLLAERVCR